MRWYLPTWCAPLLLAACTDRAAPDADAATLQPDAGTSATVVYEFPCLEPWEPTGAATYEAIYREIFCKRGCTAVYCHGSRTASGGLSLETLPIGYAMLLAGDADPQSRCATFARVVPGAPAESLLHLKLSGQTPCGDSMPPPDSGWPRLPAADVERIDAWITAGAPEH